MRIWGTERPEERNEVSLQSIKVMVWCAIAKDHIIGPIFFGDESVNGETYKRMLSRKVFPALNQLPYEYIFQRDGAPPLYY